MVLFVFCLVYELGTLKVHFSLPGFQFLKAILKLSFLFKTKFSFVWAVLTGFLSNVFFKNSSVTPRSIIIINDFICSFHLQLILFNFISNCLTSSCFHISAAAEAASFCNLRFLYLSSSLLFVRDTLSTFQMI